MTKIELLLLNLGLGGQEKRNGAQKCLKIKSSNSLFGLFVVLTENRVRSTKNAPLSLRRRRRGEVGNFYVFLEFRV